MSVISPPAVDVHAHFLPPSYRAALKRAGIDHPDGFPFVPKWSTDSALALMDEVGIDLALLSISSPGFSFAAEVERSALTRTVNEEGAAAVRDRPQRQGPLASLPLPDVDAALEETSTRAMSCTRTGSC
jgi:predicted TIM-barrel fold metal-dependent hydrolase